MAAYDRDLYQDQVVFEKPFFLLLFFLHQEVNLQLLKVPPPRVDQRYRSDLWEIQTKKNMSNLTSGLLSFSVYRLGSVTMSLFVFPTWTTVFDGDEGRKVLGVVAKHDWVFVALCGLPV